MTTGVLWIDLEAQPLDTGALYEKAAFRLLEMTSGGKARLRDMRRRGLQNGPNEARVVLRRTVEMGGHWRVSSGSSASAGATPSGESARGLGGSTKAGSTTLPFPARSGSSAGFATGCNACGRGLRATAVPALPLWLAASGPQDQKPLAARLHAPPLAAPAVRRSSPEVRAGWLSAPRPDLCGGMRSRAHPNRNIRPTWAKGPRSWK